MIDLGLSGFFDFLYRLKPRGLTTPAYLGNRKHSHQGRAKSGRVSQRMRVSPHAAVNRRPVPQVAEYVGKRRNLSARRKRRDRLASVAAMPEGEIPLNSDRGWLLGFTSDRFDGYLWKTEGAIMVSLITSYRRGNFRQLAERILKSGLAVKIPTPLGRMQEIVRKAGYRETQEEYEPFGPCDVWVLEPDRPA